jgi:hypothetical protein
MTGHYQSNQHINVQCGAQRTIPSKVLRSESSMEIIAVERTAVWPQHQRRQQKRPLQ